MRVGPDGSLVLLEDQDRSRWDAAEIAVGLDLVDAAFRDLPAGARPVPTSLQAAIAACHARSASAAATPWPEIAALYGILATVAPGPVVELNRAVAVAMAEGPAAGLALVEALGADGTLAGYQHYHAVRADLLRRLGRRAEAAAAYERAARARRQRGGAGVPRAAARRGPRRRLSRQQENVPRTGVPSSRRPRNEPSERSFASSRTRPPRATL